MSSARPKPSVSSEHLLTPTVAALTRLLDSAPVGMLVANTAGDLIFSNRAFSDLLAHPPVAGQGQNLRDLVPSDEKTSLWLQFDRLVRGEATVYRGEHRFCHADGQPLWVMLAAARFAGETSGADYITLQLTSIELQKKAEEALAYSESRCNFAL